MNPAARNREFHRDVSEPQAEKRFMHWPHDSTQELARPGTVTSRVRSLVTSAARPVGGGPGTLSRPDTGLKKPAAAQPPGRLVSLLCVRFRISINLRHEALL